MNAEKYRDHVIPATEGFLPGLWTDEAKAFILTVALQESDLEHRAQIVEFGRPWWTQPHMSYARSYFMFERIGVKEIFRNPATKEKAIEFVESLDYPPDPELVWKYMAFDPILATGIARLAIYRYPARLPLRGDVEGAWEQYLAVWKPGRPHRERFVERYKRAWEVVQQSGSSTPLNSL